MRRLGVGIVMGALVLASGCGGGEDPGPSAGTATSESVAASPESPPASSPTSPSVEPATGRSYTVGPLSARAPQGYELGTHNQYVVTFNGPQLRSWGMSAQQSSGTLSFEDLAQDPAIAFGSNQPKRLADVEIAGATFYHLAGQGSYGYTEQFGAIHLGHILELTFIDPGGASELRPWKESVLASLSFG